MGEDRRGFIGGSDVAAILGLSPWGSPWSVWAEKTGLVAPEHSDEQTERMEIGKDAERFLAEVFERHHVEVGLKIALHPGELHDSQWRHLRGHADGFVIEDETLRRDGGWEAKTANELRPWDDVPAHYQCQAQVYMMLSGLDSWWFTVGFAGWKVKHYVVLADAEDQELIAKATEKFWTEHVLTGIPPEADGHPATSAAIKHAWNVPDPDDTLYADEELDALCASLRVANADLKATEQRKAGLENRIKARMADCGVLQYGERVLATWKPQDARRIDVDRLKRERPDVADEFTNTTTSRVFRLKSPRGD